jgi:hypothetical protein
MIGQFIEAAERRDFGRAFDATARLAHDDIVELEDGNTITGRWERGTELGAPLSTTPTGLTSACAESGRTALMLSELCASRGRHERDPPAPPPRGHRDRAGGSVTAKS